MSLARQLNQSLPSSSSVGASVREHFMGEVSKVLSQLSQERSLVLENMPASEIYCAQFTKGQVESLAKSSAFLMSSSIKVWLTDADLPCSVFGRYCAILRLRAPLPFPISFESLELSASSHYGSAIQSLIRDRSNLMLPADFSAEIKALTNCDMRGLSTFAECLARLAKCGPVSNQVAFDLSKAADRFVSNPTQVDV